MRMFAVISFMCAPVLLTHMYSGLETMLFVSLILIAGYAYLKKKSTLLSITLILTSLTRPEGIAFSAVVLFLVRDKKAILVWLLAIGVYLLCKYSYYGTVLPNSFYYKSITDRLFSDNLNEFGGFFWVYLAIPTLIGIIKKRKINLPLILLFLAGLDYYLNCRLAMNYSDRFFVHLYPLVFILLAYSGKMNKHFAITLTIAQLCLFGFVLPKELSYIGEEKRIINVIKETGAYIKGHYSPESKLCVDRDAGYIPFLTMMETLDVGGLMNKDLTMYEYDNKYNLGKIFPYRIDYLFRYDPDILVVASMDSLMVPWGFESMLFSDPRIERFRCVKKFGTQLAYNHGTTSQPLETYYEFVFEKKGEEKTEH